MLARAIPLPLVALAVALTAFVNGAYFPHEWGWPALAFLLVFFVTVLVADALELSMLDAALVAALAALTAWTLLSIAWSSGATLPVLSAERLLVYVAFAAALLVTTRRASAALPLAGVLVAALAVCAYALATRCFPGALADFPPLDGYQLAEPIGYWNALGMLAALGALVASGCVAFARQALLRAVAAASLPVLVTTLYLTFSRGATIALAAGALAVVGLTRRRLRYVGTNVSLTPAVAAAVAYAAHARALRDPAATLDAARTAGGRLALVVAACVVLAAAIAVVLARHEHRVRLGGEWRRRVGFALVALALLAAAGAVAQAGGPGAIVDSFRRPLPDTGGDLGTRLTSFSSNGRSEYWRVAGKEIAAHPVLGGGAGSYERWWHRERNTAYETRNAHNVYLETLAELGPLGLALLLAAFAVPLAATVRARDDPAAVTGAAAFAAYAVHGLLDWDWQIPAVTLAALACAGAAVAAARDTPPVRIRAKPRAGALAATGALIAAAIVVQIGNSALAGSEAALDRSDPGEASRLARRAHTWAPWSFQPWQRLGQAQLEAGRAGEARASFRRGLRLDPEEWSLWSDLAAASAGPERDEAQREVERLNPHADGS